MRAHTAARTAATAVSPSAVLAVALLADVGVDVVEMMTTGTGGTTHIQRHVPPNGSVLYIWNPMKTTTAGWPWTSTNGAEKTTQDDAGACCCACACALDSGETETGPAKQIAEARTSPPKRWRRSEWATRPRCSPPHRRHESQEGIWGEERVLVGRLLLLLLLLPETTRRT